MGASAAAAAQRAPPAAPLTSPVFAKQPPPPPGPPIFSASAPASTPAVSSNASMPGTQVAPSPCAPFIGHAGTVPLGTTSVVAVPPAPPLMSPFPTMLAPAPAPCSFAYGVVPV